jgi:hypothetical protein
VASALGSWSALTVEIQIPIEEIGLVFPTLFQCKCLPLLLIQEMFLTCQRGIWNTDIFSDLLSGSTSAFLYYFVLVDSHFGIVSLVRNSQRIDTAHHGSVQVRFVGVGITIEPWVNPAFDKVKRLSKEWGQLVTDGMIKVVTQKQRVGRYSTFGYERE